MITKTQIEQQKHAIEGLYEKVTDAPDSEQKTQAIAYCEGCIAACSLALQVMNGAIPSDEKTKVDEPVEEKVTETVEIEEKPKRKSSKKKKEEPAKVVEPEMIESEVEEEDDDDLDDLL